MESDLIYDVGMCDGADTAFYLAKGFRVVAVEANPALVERNRARFSREIEDGRLIILNTAIGPAAGRAAFDVHTSNEHWSSIVTSRRPQMAGQYKTIDVECATLDAVVKQYGVPYYLKIDIEEADLCAIQSLDGLLERPIYISAEAHSSTIVDSLHRQGYRFFKLVDQATKNQLRMWPWGWREGRYVWLNFTDSHSGPFGEESPGQWLDRDQVLAEFFRLQSSGGLVWHDFHAKLPTAPRRSFNIRAYGSLPSTVLRLCGRSARTAAIRTAAWSLRRILSPKQYDRVKAWGGRTVR
jgi:FkbM family methyltransferase